MVTGLIDFTVFYVAGQTITGAIPLHLVDLYNPALLRPLIRAIVPPAGTHFLYLPPAAVLFAPLTLLPFQLAAKVWLMSNIVLVIVCYYLSIYYLIPDHHLFRYRYSIGLVIILFSSTVHSLLKTGQVNAWLWLLFILGLIGLVYKKPVVTGISLGVAAIFKVFPVIFLPYLFFKKQYTAALYFIITDIVLMLLSLPWFSLTSWWWFISQRLPDILFGNLGSITTSVSFYGTLRWLIRYHAWDVGLQPKMVVTWLYYPYLIITLLLLSSVTYLLWRYRQQQRWVLDYFLILIVVLVCAKMVQPQYLLWIVSYLLWLSKKLPWSLLLGLVILTQYTLPVLTTMGLIGVLGLTVWLYCRGDKKSV